VHHCFVQARTSIAREVRHRDGFERKVFRVRIDRHRLDYLDSSEPADAPLLQKLIATHA
jgi:hypothetical protein